MTNKFLCKYEKDAHDLTLKQNDTQITDELQLANLLNNYFSHLGSELKQKIPINVSDSLSFFDDADETHSSLRFYEWTPDEVGMLFGKFPNKCSSSDKIPTSIYKKLTHILASVIFE